MSNNIERALSRLFERHRIVFWYDTKQELREDFESLALPDIEKLELLNNEFSIKHRLLREAPEQKFLLYREGEQPADLDNWLLDIQLAHGEFRTDQVALWLSELALGLDFVEMASAHAEFFRAVKRKDALKRLLKSEDTPGSVRLKMLGVCAGAEPRLDTVLEGLLEEHADARDEKFKLIERCGLDSVLWEQMKRVFGYQSDTPGIRDFVIELFKSCYAMGTDGEVLLSSDALVFLRRWKDSRQYERSFEQLSDECANALNIEQDLGKRDFRDLIELDYFRLIDLKIIAEMVHGVAERTVSSGDIAQWVRQRRQGHWYAYYRDLYEAIDFASRFVHALDQSSLSMDSLADGVAQYARSWFRLDQLYRKYIYHVRRAGEISLMEALTEQLENLYSNNFLLKLNDRWQVHVDAAEQWNAAPVLLQRNFFEQQVSPFLSKGKKVYVIVSDALRYEIGEELLRLIRHEDRFDAKLLPALSMLPSYTQLGMAALLPNTQLALTGSDTASVEVDGQSSQGTQNRAKILAHKAKYASTALQAKRFMAMNRDECRTLAREHDVVYIYHNLIDKTGDDRDSEERVFEAAEQTLQELIKMIKKLANANASNVLLTSDHGFIYQNRAIEESDFSSAGVEGDEILYRDRRFVLGRGLKPAPGLKTFSSAQLGLVGDMEVHIPKSINRLRRKGSGSRFVHGGAALQEVVIPVIQINKKRSSDVSAVEVDMLRAGNSLITSGQVSLGFYQTEPSTDKIQPRTLRAGIYTQAGELVSDSHELLFDFTSDNPRERELKVRFILTRAADEANGQDVILRLEEKLAGTSHYKEYKTLSYTIRRAFTSDFDF